MTISSRISGRVPLCLLLLLCACFSVAQEKPFTDVTRFRWDLSYRTDVCQRQRMVYNDEISIADALVGLNLSVAITQYTKPFEDKFFNLDGNGAIPSQNPGLFVILMDQLAERAGFNWRDNFVAIEAIDLTADKVNRTWSDLLEWQVNTFDISVDNWAKTVPRMGRGIAFPEGWFDSSLILVQRVEPDSDKVDMWSFLTPFTFPVWAMIAVAVVSTGIMYWMLERLNGSSDDGHLENKPLGTMFMSALTFTGHFDFQPNTHSARILSFSWAFFSLVSVSAYTANLASFLVARRTPDFKIRTIPQAVRYNAPICIHGRSSQDELITAKYSDAMLVRKQFERDVYEGLKNGECAVAVSPVNSYEIYVRSASMNRECTFQSEKRVIEILSGGIATAVDSGTLCTSLIDNVLDLYLTQLKAEGWIEEEWNKHLQKAGDVSCLAEGDIPGTGEMKGGVDEETVSLTLEEMSGIFILHGIAAALALTIALVRFFLLQRNGKKDMLEKLGLASEKVPNATSAEDTSHQTENRASATSELPSTVVHPSKVYAPNEYWIRDREIRDSINYGL